MAARAASCSLGISRSLHRTAVLPHTRAVAVLAAARGAAEGPACRQRQRHRPAAAAAAGCASSRRQLLRAGPLLPALLPLLGAGCTLVPLSSGAAGVSRGGAAAMSTSASAPAGAGASPTGAIVVYVTVPSAQVNRDPELLLIIKTREQLLEQLTAFVRANHPYDEPEVVGLPILGGSPSYLKWLHESASGGPQAP
ncbi:hypothetical protein GPECTOR_88g465 [Gonium pectorale]|uniref:Uncharacterized protein n=1 Tax=Gonium pectorale TaxID=33097 RepID=A0A150G0Z3_GONPE|nr:hypothetical protein GPECTOR_88g465 [Gonium pectorale]|eukprot:KXZ43522.1 hypothetical protein GPECTOR_88g465 [Gonium pectorale]